ncbi:hypothetical protein M407DRAFT_245014 [Tulasnella calospora MUT 4182]|uniref:Uncharacterized protein n=1 Tax=Tulasnella calospora MUT 4182 TaxID=1051891 RepID=A0A0C3Q2U0_9AGAM|nr:hypothetical protein M407DRAFT_245014 [Tulasnella calospora MUT 4182]
MSQAPPEYQAGKPTNIRDEIEATQPLLGQSSRSGGGVYDQPGFGELPDDFKYGVSVYESAPEIRQAFVRKVYSILFAQLLATTVVSGYMQYTNASVWIQNNLWAFYTAMIGSFVTLGLVWWKRHSHPINLVLLSAFTLCEAFTVGLVVGFYDQIVVLQALVITMGVFLGLTLWTMQSKYDFTGMGTFLFGGLLVLCLTGIVGIFIPFGKTMDLIYALGGTLLFSGYIVYDTFLIMKKLSPDESIMAAINLYLDFINLFLYILRALNNVEER